MNLGAILQLLETLILEALSIKKALATGVLCLGTNLHKRKVLHPKLLEGNVGQRWTNFFSSSDIGQPKVVGVHFLCLMRPAIKGSILSILLAPTTIEAVDGVVV